MSLKTGQSKATAAIGGSSSEAKTCSPDAKPSLNFDDWLSSRMGTSSIAPKKDEPKILQGTDTKSSPPLGAWAPKASSTASAGAASAGTSGSGVTVQLAKAPAGRPHEEL